MSRMGMLKTISGRFGHGVGEQENEIDNGAEKPDNPKKDKKQKRSKGVPNVIQEDATPAIFHKPDKHAIKQGHDPNKVEGVGISTRNIIVEPSKRHLNYQASTRNINDSQKSAGSSSTDSRPMRNLDKKSSMRNMNSNDKKNSVDKKNNTRNTNSLDKRNMRSLSKVDEIGMSSIDEIGKQMMMSTIEESVTRNINAIDEKSTRNTNQNSTSSKSTGSVDIKSNGNVDKSSSINNKSNHSTNTKNSENARNADNISPRSPRKQRGRPAKRAGGTFDGTSTPMHFSRDRPSTALITRKELEEILTAKRKEEMLEKQTKPPKSGTLSTDLWVAEANNTLDESSQASVTSYEESPHLGNDPDPIEMDDEYDINFFDFDEEEVTVHESSAHMEEHLDSFDADELDPAGSMEPRCTTIRFDEYDELQTCLHINDFTKHEISRSWYKREDYDKMVDLARKTASKAVKREKELREELETVLSQSPSRKGKNGKAIDENDVNSGHARSVGPDGKRKKPIEYRGLEAWTPEGSSKCRSLKETAIEKVWNEQSRQWEDGTFDPDAISEVYRPVAKTALAAAHERALGDMKMVKKLMDQEEARAEKKRNRGSLLKSKSAIKKGARSAGKGLVQGTGKMVHGTGKVGKTIGKRGIKAVVATATLDPRMMKEAAKVRIHGKKKRECKQEKTIATSRAAHERDAEELEESGSLSVRDTSGPPFIGRPGLTRSGLPTPYEINEKDRDRFSDDLSSNADFRDYSSRSFQEGETESQLSTTDSAKKKSKLKFLGVVPIPGTQKMYSEDRREQRANKRLAKMNRRPSWEASMTVGKY